jgi:hypothetical protein
MRRSAAALAALVLAATAAKAEEVRCVAPGASPVTISLKARRFAGREMSCIAGDFVVDLTPCAPRKAFSLSAPTGAAGIVRVVDRWQDYAGHAGGVVGFFKTHTTISFTGGFNDPASGLRDDWSFTVDRQDRSGLLTRKGRPATAFRCSGAL